MKKTNPYQNHAHELYFDKGVRHPQAFINNNIKDAQVNITMSMILENAQHLAFELGRKQGRYEASLALKELIDVENPGFIDADDTGGY